MVVGLEPDADLLSRHACRPSHLLRFPALSPLAGDPAPVLLGRRRTRAFARADRGPPPLFICPGFTGPRGRACRPHSSRVRPETSGGRRWTGRARLSATLAVRADVQVDPPRCLHRDTAASGWASAGVRERPLMIVTLFRFHRVEAARKHGPAKGQPEKYASTTGATSS